MAVAHRRQHDPAIAVDAQGAQAPVVGRELGAEVIVADRQPQALAGGAERGGVGRQLGGGVAVEHEEASAPARLHVREEAQLAQPAVALEGVCQHLARDLAQQGQVRV